MCHTIICFISAMRWPETISALAALATAVIACCALQTWRHQEKAKNRVEFLDALIEAAHSYIAEMSKPITLLLIAKIGMESHSPTWADDKQSDIAIKGAIAYIEKSGERDGKRLMEALKDSQTLVVKLRSLAVKGQIYNFHNYTNCLNAVEALTCHFERIKLFLNFISSPTWNWENLEVLEHLKQIMAIDADEIRKGIKESNIMLIEYITDTYKKIYG